MSWLKDLVRPKITTRTKRDIPADLWQKCTSCGEMLYGKDLAANLQVCTACNHHMRISQFDRMCYLFDNAEKLDYIKVTAPKADPLQFKDRKAYAARIKEAKAQTGEDDAFNVVKGTIQKQPLIACLMNFDFMAGSMGSYVGEAIVTAAQTALEQKLPLLLVTQSGGARMQEGILSLMQMARTTAAINALKEAKLPYIVLLTDPTTGGVTASFAMTGDVTLAEPGALIGFAGPRVIKQTIGETLPEGFQTAEYLRDKGMIDQVISRKDQPATIAALLKLLTANRG
jgi:acetyl-CoA carboxylase carboxyl transferase subunit beta